VFFLLPCSSTHLASVIAVVQLGETVISTCSAYGNAYKNASKDMDQLSEEVWRLLLVLKAIHKLIKDEETKTSTRLPTLTAAFNASYHHKTHDSHSDNQGLENESGLEYNTTNSAPSIHSGRRGLVTRFWKKLKSKDAATTVETQGRRTIRSFPQRHLEITFNQRCTCSRNCVGRQRWRYRRHAPCPCGLLR
jgi:hypothetical protein